MELYMYPKEHERIRDWIKQVSAFRATLPDDGTAEDEAQTPQAHFQANQLLGLPLPPAKGEKRPILKCSWTLKKNNIFKPKKAAKFDGVLTAPTKRVIWIANLKQGLPFWNRYTGITCDAFDVSDKDGHLVTVSSLTVTWYKILGTRRKSRGMLLADAQVTIQDVNGCLGTPRMVRAFEGQRALIVFERHVILLCPTEPTMVYEYSSEVSSAVYILGRVIVGTRNGYLIDGTTTTDMPYRTPVTYLEHQGGGVLLAATRSAIYRFHVSPEIGPYQLNVPCPMGVTGCGALIGSVSLTGNVWLTNTFAKQQVSRNINPPPGIAKNIDLDPKKEKKKSDDDNPTTFWRLNYPFQYQYRAVWMGRLELHVLYPDMSIRKLLFKVLPTEQ